MFAKLFLARLAAKHSTSRSLQSTSRTRQNSRADARRAQASTDLSAVWVQPSAQQQHCSSSSCVARETSHWSADCRRIDRILSVRNSRRRRVAATLCKLRCWSKVRQYLLTIHINAHFASKASRTAHTTRPPFRHVASMYATLLLASCGDDATRV